MVSMEQVKELLAPGHRACPGCGCAIAVRLILRATGSNVIVVSPTGCLETFTSPIDFSSWEVPWVHSLFENAPAVASGVLAALNIKGNPDQTKVIVIGGDGSTYDIGMGSLSGMFERKEEILYICYDNEAYMNTGVQGSSATPYAATSTTTPVGTCSFGKAEPKKDLPAIAIAHGVPYVATANIAYPQDLMRKVKKGLQVRGPAYLHVLCPCNLGWGFEPHLTVEIARKASETGLFPIFEYEDGQLMNVRKLSKKIPIEEYLKDQRRFRHLLTDRVKYQNQVETLQNTADQNCEKYHLL
jgi:pyruvate ferredoxin oxidoreductase beta subunit